MNLVLDLILLPFSVKGVYLVVDVSEDIKDTFDNYLHYYFKTLCSIKRLLMTFFLLYKINKVCLVAGVSYLTCYIKLKG